MKKKSQPAVPAAPPADAHRALLGAFEKAANSLRLMARQELLLVRDDWRPVKAGIIAAQLVARVLGCSSEKATEHCERAMNSGPGVVSGQESSLESQLVNLAAWVGAFHHLTAKAGHLPGAVLKAVTKDLQLDHDLFGYPNVVPILEAAVKRHRAKT